MDEVRLVTMAGSADVFTAHPTTHWALLHPARIIPPPFACNACTQKRSAVKRPLRILRPNFGHRNPRGSSPHCLIHAL